LKRYSLLQSSVSHDPSEIIQICRFAAQETFFYYHQCWRHLCCFIFLWKPCIYLKWKYFVRL